MIFHHLGLAVTDIDKGLKSLGKLGAVTSSILFEDPEQNVKVQFALLGGVSIELVAPLGPKSPVDSILKLGGRFYHVCYEVEDIEDTIKVWRAAGAMPLSSPKPAVAFEGRRIVFMLTHQRLLFEFLECQKPSE